MKRCDTWRADSFRFTVAGPGAQHFLSSAARRGIRLRQLRCEGAGYSGRAAGADRAALEALAGRGGWQFAVVERRGPGRMLDRALARPGVPLGAVLFLVLVRLLSAFVWAIDFGELDSRQAASLRTLLAENDIWEGCLLTDELLQQAQQQASRQSEAFGWISLNFTGGCLFVESTPAQYQNVRAEPEAAALVARAGGQVLAVEVESGFAAVQPDQYVAAGQLLASGVKQDRSGNPVTQPPSGTVIARVEKSYTAQQPLQAEQTVLTGRRSTGWTLHLLGRTAAGEPAAGEGGLRREWQPLRLGRLALPGCLVWDTRWEQARQTVRCTAEAAQALARRDCRRQLLAEFPDAQIEAMQYEEHMEGDTACCTASYVFCANIAVESAENPAAADEKTP